MSGNGAQGGGSPGGSLAPWQLCFVQAAANQKAKQITPFRSIIGSYAAVRSQLSEAQEENITLKKELANANAAKDAVSEELTKAQYALKGVVVKSGREKELEGKNIQLNEQIRNALGQMQDYLDTKQRLQELETTHADTLKERDTLKENLQSTAEKLADRENVVKLLKQEVGALQSENQIQRESFAQTKEENQRLLPMIMEAKTKEAELMDQILVLEQQLSELSKGGGLPNSVNERRSSHEPSRVFQDENASMVGMGAMCAKPSYIAHQVESCHDGDIHALTITESGRHIWTGGTDRRTKCWDSTNGNPITKIETGAAVLCLDSSADLLVAGCSDATCRIYDLATQRGRCQLTGHSEKVTASYLNGDATRVYTASSDRSLRSWDLTRGGNLIGTTLCFSAVNDIAVSHDRICSAHYDTTIRLWDCRTGKAYAEIPKAHDKTVTCVRFTQDGYKVVSLSRDHTIRQFDLRVMKETLSLTSPSLHIASNVTRLTLSPDDRFVAVGTSLGNVLVWDLAPGATPIELKNGHKAHSPVGVVCWSPDARGVASAGSDRRLVFWR